MTRDDQIKRQARAYADRVVRRKPRSTQTTGDPVPWIVAYMRRYRSLTGRPGYAGPKPVWVRLSKGVKP